MRLKLLPRPRFWSALPDGFFNSQKQIFTIFPFPVCIYIIIIIFAFDILADVYGHESKKLCMPHFSITNTNLLTL